MNLQVDELETIEYEVMEQVDRSEKVEALYIGYQLDHGLGLGLQKRSQKPIIEISSWSEAGIAGRIKKWQATIANGGRILAASKGDKVVGFGIIGPRQLDGSIELCALFISAEMRQSGVGTILFHELEAMAKREGAISLLIYSNPTESAVDFYIKQNCKIIGLADKRLVTHLPWDVVFAKSLG